MTVKIKPVNDDSLVRDRYISVPHDILLNADPFMPAITDDPLYKELRAIAAPGEARREIEWGPGSLMAVYGGRRKGRGVRHYGH